MSPNQFAALVVLNSADAEAIRQALDAFGCRTKSFTSFDELRRDLAGGRGDDFGAVVVAGGDDALVDSRHVADLNTQHPELALLVVGSKLSIDSAVSFIKQGASSAAGLPATSSSLVEKIRDLLEEASTRRGAFGQRIELKTRLASLTPAEDQVLELLLTGMANKQISQSLGIGLRTVELRRSKIMRKMDSKTVAELIKMVCIARGVSELSPSTGSAV